MKLSPMQLTCLQAIGITPWHEKPVASNIQSAAKPNYVATPELVVQIELALAYVAKHNQGNALSWLCESTVSNVSLNNKQLSLPPLEQLFASTELKKQLWQLLIGYKA